jgi:DNA-binding MarR family transcriptional regulator
MSVDVDHRGRAQQAAPASIRVLRRGCRRAWGALTPTHVLGQEPPVDPMQEAFSDLLDTVQEAVAAAGAQWEDRAVAATAAIIGAWDGDRGQARLCVFGSAAAPEQSTALRQDATRHIGALLADAPQFPALGEAMAAGAIGALWQLVGRWLTEDPDAALASLYGPAVYIVLTPFVGRQRAAQRAAEPAPMLAVAASDLGFRSPEPIPALTELGQRTLRYLADHPGASNLDVVRALAIRYPSQVSRHLTRLKASGLAECRRAGRTNAWTLTARGERAARWLRAAAQHDRDSVAASPVRGLR